MMRISTERLAAYISALILLTSLSGGALAGEKSNPLTPADTSSPRSTLIGFIEAVNTSHDQLQLVMASYHESPRLYFSAEENTNIGRVYEKIGLARRALNLSDLPTALAATEPLLRYRIFQLKEVLDRLELPALEDMPDADAMVPREFKRWTLPGTEIVIERVEHGARAGEYLFSPETVERLPEFYERIRHLPYVTDTTSGWYERYRYGGAGLRKIVPLKWMMSMPRWANVVVFEQPVWRWTGLIVLLLFSTALFVAFRGISNKYVSHRSVSWFLTQHSQLLQVVFLLALIPLVVRVLTINLRFSGVALEVATLFMWAAYTIILTWTVWLGSSVLAESIVSSQRLMAGSIDSQLIRLVLRLIATILSIFILVVGAQQLGIPAYSIIAGLGVGGIAFALAAKDSLANLLGSLLIMFEKPFRVGHWIKVGEMEGVVESIGFRSTRIRTFHNSVMSIPSDQLVNSTVDNMTLRDRSVTRTVLKISYATSPEKVEEFVSGVSSLIEESPLTYKKRFLVRLDELGEHGLHILVTFSMDKHTDQSEELERQKILLGILTLAETMDVQLVDHGS